IAVGADVTAGGNVTVTGVKVTLGDAYARIVAGDAVIAALLLEVFEAARVRDASLRLAASQGTATLAGTAEYHGLISAGLAKSIKSLTRLRNIAAQRSGTENPV